MELNNDVQLRILRKTLSEKSLHYMEIGLEKAKGIIDNPDVSATQKISAFNAIMKMEKRLNPASRKKKEKAPVPGGSADYDDDELQL